MTDADDEAWMVADTLDVFEGEFRSLELRLALTAESDRSYDTDETNDALHELWNAGYVERVHEDRGTHDHRWRKNGYDTEGAYETLSSAASTRETKSPMERLLEKN